MLWAVEFATFEAVKDPLKEAAAKLQPTSCEPTGPARSGRPD